MERKYNTYIFNLLMEGVETKNMKAAKHYLYQNRNCDENVAMRIIGNIKHDIPNSRLGKCKFMLAMVRMFCNGEFSDGQTMIDINDMLGYAVRDSYIGRFDQDLNGLTANEFIQSMRPIYQQELQNNRELTANQEYEEPEQKYQIVKICCFEQAEEYANEVDWCITQSKEHYVQYTNNMQNVFYFCLADGYEDVEAKRGDNCPLDEYGLSMIAVSIKPDGSANTITCRWNHNNGGSDQVMSPDQLSKVIGKDFYSVFKPLTDEDIQRMKMNEVYEIEQELESYWYGYSNEKEFLDNVCEKIDFSGACDKDLYVFPSMNDRKIIVDDEVCLLVQSAFDDVDVDAEGGIISVTDNDKHAFLTPDGKYLINQWFDKVFVTFECGFSLVYLENRGWNILNLNGEICMEWCKSMSFFKSKHYENGIVEYVDKNGLMGFYDVFNDTHLFNYGITDVRIVRPIMFLKFEEQDYYVPFKYDTVEELAPYEIERVFSKSGQAYISVVIDGEEYAMSANGDLYTPDSQQLVKRNPYST